ncbi:MAG: DUF6624 domain-containing protein [Bacteroidota bacterium]
MKKLLCLFFSGIFLFTTSANAQKSTKEKPKYPELAKELVKMRSNDQKLRIKWSKMIQEGKNEGKKYEKLTDRLIKADSSNTERMKEIVAQYGWPTRALVGNGASSSAWLLVQHADRDPLFQIKCLPLLKAAVDQEQTNPRNYAYLYDRVQVAKGDMQLYATQSTTNNGLKQGFFQTIEDEANVQKRRAAMNIDQHIEDYAKALGFDYKVPTPEEAMQREQALLEKYQENLEQAQAAMKNKDYESAAEHYLVLNETNGATQTTDYVEMARALSLAKHKDAYLGTYALIKAAIRGYEQMDEFEMDQDFEYLKEVSPRNWGNLRRIMKELEKK